MTAPSLQRSVGSGASGGWRWHSDFCEKPVLIHAMAPRHRCSHHRIRRKVELAPNHPRIICTIRPIGLGQERCSLLSRARGGLQPDLLELPGRTLGARSKKRGAASTAPSYVSHVPWGLRVGRVAYSQRIKGYPLG